MKIIILILLFICSCSNNTNNTNTINTATSVDLDSLDPYKMVSSRTEEILRNVYEGLVIPSHRKGKVEPAIAKNYIITDNGKKYIFEIRDDIYFHDGSKLTMNDVIFSLKKAIELKLEKEFENIKKIDSKDNKLILTLKEPDYSLIYYLIVPIVNSKTYGNIKNNGTGPYYIHKYQEEQFITLKKFNKYYGKKANIDNINIYIIPDENTQMLKFLSGELNLLLNVNKHRINELKNKKILTQESNNIFIMGINNKKHNKDMRIALNSAVNRDEIINIILNGYGTKIGYETDKNLELLKGKNFEMKVSTHNPIYKDTAQIIAQNLKKYGANLKIIPTEWSSWLTNVYQNRDFDLTLISFTGKLDEDAIYRRYKSNYYRNFNNYSNKNYDKLINSSKLTNDRVNIFSMADDILYKDIPNVFLFKPNNIVAMDKNIYGFTFYNLAFINFSNLYFK